MQINHDALEWVADYILPFGNNATVSEPEALIKLMPQKTHYFCGKFLYNSAQRLISIFPALLPETAEAAQVFPASVRHRKNN